MNEPNKIIYLQDYIAKKKNIVPFTKDHHIGSSNEWNLLNPNSVLLRRGIAFFVDLLVIGLFKVSIQSAYAIFLNEYFAPIDYGHKANLVQGNIVLHLSIFLIIYFSYFLFTSYVLNGKTVGKMSMGLRIINDDFVSNLKDLNYDLTLRQCFKRSFGYLLCYLSFGTFFIFNFSSEDKRGLPDYISGSRTVSDKWLMAMSDFKNHQNETITIDIQTLSIAS